MTRPIPSMPFQPQAPSRATRVLGVALAFIVLIGPIRAQATVPVVAYDGSEIFCHILKHFKFEPIGSVDELSKHPSDETLIVVFGTLKPLENFFKSADTPLGWPSLDDYAFLLASDHPTGRIASPMLQKAGYQVRDSHLEYWNLMIPDAQVWQPEADAYQGKTRCPLLKPDQLRHEHPVFRGIFKGIATNRPAFLRGQKPKLQLLVDFPWNCRSTLGRDFGGPNDGYVFGSDGASQQRTLILAGHGVFMNGMLAQDDNDNGLFTINTIRWLRGPDNKRKYALMIHDGKVIDSFDLPLTQLPNIPLPPVQVINQMLRELENEGVFNRFLEEVVGWPVVLRFAILVGTIAIFIYGFYRLFPMRYRHESVPLIVGHPPGPTTNRSLTTLRQWELLTQDNLWEPAQALARQWFIDHAQVHAPLWDRADPSPPLVEVRGGWMVRRRLTQQVHALWEFAIRDPGRSVSQREFGRLTDMLAALDEAARDGRIVARGNSA